MVNDFIGFEVIHHFLYETEFYGTDFLDGFGLNIKYAAKRPTTDAIKFNGINIMTTKP